MRRYIFTFFSPPSNYTREIEIKAVHAVDALVMAKVRVDFMNRNESEGTKWVICNMMCVIPSRGEVP